MRTRIFDLAAQYEWTDQQLADRMGISAAQVSRVRHGINQVGRDFIVGALRAFPDRRFEDLFDVEKVMA